MADPLIEARSLKAKAVALRNRGTLQRTLDILDEAIKVLETQRPDSDTSTNASDICAELADTHGMKGGVFRRIGDLDAALAAYTTGARIEESNNLGTTYNRSNLITLNITAKGLAPTDHAIRTQLVNVIGHLEVETAGSRRDEWWAWADLAQFHLLNGEPDKARKCYTNAISKTGATAEEIRRHATILGELADKTAGSAPTIAATIRAAIDELPR